MKENIKNLWENYLTSIGENPENTKLECKIVEYFGNNKIADELFNLVYSGKKTATCGSLWSYEAEKTNPLEKGDLNIVTDYCGKKACVIKTTNIKIKKFIEISEVDARLEGEGDLSLKYWREEHKKFFEEKCKEIGKEFSEKMPVVFEEFEVVYK
jgi:uncharacterized protein YhfF